MPANCWSISKVELSVSSCIVNIFLIYGQVSCCSINLLVYRQSWTVSQRMIHIIQIKFNAVAWYTDYLINFVSQLMFHILTASLPMICIIWLCLSCETADSYILTDTSCGILKDCVLFRNFYYNLNFGNLWIIIPNIFNNEIKYFPVT